MYIKKYFKEFILFLFILCFGGVFTLTGKTNTDMISNYYSYDFLGKWTYSSIDLDSSKVIEIRSTGIELSYDITEIRANAGDTLTIRYDNSDSDMAHNIVLVRNEEDIRPVGIAAMQAYRNDYIPEDEMDRIIAYSKLAHPGDIIEFSFVVPPPGTYPYICTYSGHFTMMQGRLISEE